MTLIIVLMMTCFLSGCAISFLPERGERRFRGSLALAGGGSLIIFGCGIFYIFNPMEWGEVIFPAHVLVNGLPEFSISVYADRLAALFLILTGGLSLAAVLHMFDCLVDIPDRSRVVAAYNVFILSLAFTILANSVYMFLVALECITLSYAYLVLFQHNRDVERVPGESISAAKTAFKTYLIFEHGGGLLVLIALMLLSAQVPDNIMSMEGCHGQHGIFPSPLGFDFDVLRCFGRQGDTLHGTVANLIFLFALLGFGIKVGIFPTHIWVPLTHPYAPPSFPALMSGVGLAVSGLYGMYRVFFEFTGPGQFWWGLVVLLLAGASALTGAFTAMIGRDLKNALASYSIAHMGIILAGIGLAMLYRWAAQYAVSEMPALFTPVAHSFQLLTVLALIASLYHLVNHAVFKALLYFAEGAVENRMGTTALNRLGGLIKRYPWISAAFLVGTFSLAGLPPFNGFVSQWLTLQALFGGMNLFLPAFAPRVTLLGGLVVALLSLGLAFGVTALGSVKIAGEVLLGSPRDEETARRSQPGEVSWRVRIVLVGLAGLCLVMGLLPAVTAQGLGVVARDLSASPDNNPLQMSALNLIIHIPGVEGITPVSSADQQAGQPTYQTRLSGRLLVVLAGILAFPFLLNIGLRFSKWGRGFQLRRGPVWTGGTPYQPERMQVTGSAFSSQVWMPFEAQGRQVFRQSATAGMVEETAFPTAEALTEQRMVPQVFRYQYDFVVRRMLRLATRFGAWAQPGDIRRYFFYLLIVFFIVLVILFQMNGSGAVR